MSGAPKCGKCSKTVYDQEKQAYRGGFWHDFCFRCQGCNTRLTTGAQVDHGDMPYCKSCYDKNFRPKGFHGGSTVDSFQSAPVRVDAANPAGPAPTQAAVNAAASSSAKSPASPAAASAASINKSGYCTKCGEMRAAGANFCGKCGTKA